MSRIAIIGGTGLEKLPPEYETRAEVISTRHGDAAIVRARHGANEFLFVSRHGAKHGIAPHEINYRANIAALVDLGVTDVLATNAVGSLRTSVTPGSLVLLSDFIDFTRTRGTTYWLNTAQVPIEVMHTDFSHPYSPELRATLLDCARTRNIALIEHGTYLCVEGPRFETPAEVRMFGAWGADVVGMTGLPEAVFAREAGLRYAAIAIVTNYAAGLSDGVVAHEDVIASMAASSANVRELLLAAAKMVNR